MIATPPNRIQDVAPTSLYVHIPFCKSRCFYCDFNTYIAPERVMEEYMRALDTEFALLADNVSGPLQTVFFGGGTPTLPPPALLERMLTSLHAHFSLAPGAEVTFESNPDSVDEEKLRLLKGHGVTRLSFGAQTFQDRLLLTIGRSHDAAAVLDRVETAARLGFEHLNVDLMFGLPEQTMEDVDDALNHVLALPIDHVSAYWLKVEEGTPFGKWRAMGQLPLPGEDAEADMYEAVRNKLTANGMRHYEISNFAKAGGEARHNLVYWRNQPYLAAGAGAHGYVKGTRYENIRRIPDYMASLANGERPVDDSYPVSQPMSTEDFMMLGLRLDEGVSQTEFEQRYGVEMTSMYGSTIDDLCRRGLLERRGDRYRIPNQYWPVANVIFEKFVTA